MTARPEDLRPTSSVALLIAEELDEAPGDGTIRVGTLRDRLRSLAGDLDEPHAQVVAWCLDADGRYSGTALIED